MEVGPADLLELPADAQAAGLARAAVRERLRAWGLEDFLDTAVLLTSEVVTNAILHTASTPVLRIAREGAVVLVTVIDGSSVPPERRLHSATATTGRGVELLEQLADGWGWRPSGSGKAVWFRVGGDRGTTVGDPASSAPAGREASPMGRYAAAENGGAATVVVRLLGVPVRVLAAAREHHDGLMREFRLLALANSAAGAGAGAGVPARLVELTRELGLRYAIARSRPDAEVDRALQLGRDTVDLSYRVLPTVVEAARRLHRLSAEADELCRTAQLITLARTPVMVRLATWYTDEIVSQVAGRTPEAWDGPLDLA